MMKKQGIQFFFVYSLIKKLEKTKKNIPLCRFLYGLISIKNRTKHNGVSAFLSLGGSSADGGAREDSEQIRARI